MDRWINIEKDRWIGGLIWMKGCMERWGDDSIARSNNVHMKGNMDNKIKECGIQKRSQEVGGQTKSWAIKKGKKKDKKEEG